MQALVYSKEIDCCHFFWGGGLLFTCLNILCRIFNAFSIPASIELFRYHLAKVNDLRSWSRRQGNLNINNHNKFSLIFRDNFVDIVFLTIGL